MHLEQATHFEGHCDKCFAFGAECDVLWVVDVQ